MLLAMHAKVEFDTGDPFPPGAAFEPPSVNVKIQELKIAQHRTDQQRRIRRDVMSSLQSLTASKKGDGF